MANFANGGLSSDQKVKLICKDAGVLKSVRQTSSSSTSAGLLQHLALASDRVGVVFPYTPTVQISHDVNYGTYDIVHSNYQPHYYTNSQNPSLSVTATFTAQTQHDALYSAAAIHFFKSMTKMDFGEGNRGTSGTGMAGMPPPVLLFSAYGILNSKNIPVVLKNFSYTLPEDVDYVTFEDSPSGELVSVPTQFVVSLTLGVQYTPSKMREFNIEKYRSGDALRGDIGFL